MKERFDHWCTNCGHRGFEHELVDTDDPPGRTVEVCHYVWETGDKLTRTVCTCNKYEPQADEVVEGVI